MVTTALSRVQAPRVGPDDDERRHVRRRAVQPGDREQTCHDEEPIRREEKPPHISWKA
jgi:hypothetical protein